MEDLDNKSSEGRGGGSPSRTLSSLCLPSQWLGGGHLPWGSPSAGDRLRCILVLVLLRTGEHKYQTGDSRDPESLRE